MENKEKVFMELEAELAQILRELGMPPESHRDFGWLQEVILMSVRHHLVWELQYAEYLCNREGITCERIRQILHKAVWNNWKVDSKDVLKEHFGADVQIKFEYVKPNHVEFVRLMSDNLRKKYQI